MYYRCTTGVLPVYYRQDRYRDSTGVQTVQMYSTVQVYGTVQVYSTVQVYGTVQEICTVQVYRQYRFTRQVYYWCSTDSTGAGEELTLITQLGLSYIEDRCRTGVGQVH